MIKKLALLFFVFILSFKINSQTKLFNDDGTFRTDGYYLINMCDIPLIPKANKVNGFSQEYKNWGTYEQQYSSKNQYKPLIAIRFYDNNYAQLIMKQYYYWEMQSFLIGGFEKDGIVRIYSLHNDNVPVNENYEFIHEGHGNGNGLSWKTFVKNWNYKEKDLSVSFAYDFKSSSDTTIKYRSKFLFNREDKKIYYQLEEDSKIVFNCESSTLEFVQTDELNEDIIIAKKRERQELQAKADKEWKIQQEKNRIAAIEFEKNRKLKLKSATVGDRICYSQNWSHTESSSGFFGFGAYENKINYKMMIVCYIEKKEGDKFQVRVANIESTNKNEYSTPDYKGVKMREETIHWINPFTDTNWLICE